MKKLLFSVTLADCEIQHFCTGGPGGQKQNKTASGSRVIHTESGAVGECRNHRSQKDNTREAFVRMAKTAKFLAWNKLKAAKMMGKKTTEDIVKEQMTETNVKTEVQIDGKYVPVLSAMYCEHANENPAQCTCPANCYCQFHTCKDRVKCLECYDTGTVSGMGYFDSDKRCQKGCPVKESP